MKIAINATILDDRPTGLGVFTINIIQNLSKLIDSKKDEIIVYTSNPSFFREYPVTIKKVNSMIQPKRGKLGGVIRFLWSQFIFPLRLKADRIDILYSTTHHGTFFTKKKQILTIHDLLPLKFPKQHKLQYYYFKYVLPLLLKKASKIITVSENTKKDIYQHYNYPLNKIHIVPNSYNKEHFCVSKETIYKEKYGDYILFVGASYPHKNLIKAIEAFFLVKDKLPSCKLVITGGREEYREKIKERFKDFKDFNKIVVFINYVQYKDLPTLYSNALALLYPSLYEGFGIPPIEAMACGCPVIVSNTSSLPEVCGEAAYYINPEDVIDIAKGIETVLKNENLRKQLSVKGLERVKKYSWEESAKKLLDCLI
ncbi:glycosyltransferase family 1 protein [Geobacillus sp. PK12]|uniref:glycosyltransferase family 4 protein n=1 Tax=Geobacillus sp. PK12 TaxID=2508525 RepID=UPI0010107067|nr:glycosyltransferase family 1 protein [Geobacillus sp. PK12]RXS89208.1 glycosyltransferase family 1 protein [Geobacillus sp. PK12]